MLETKSKFLPVYFAVLAAALYAVNIPLSKLMLVHVQPTMLAALLYLGAGAGLLLCRSVSRGKTVEAPLSRQDLPYTAAMVLLDIAAPVLLMFGLQRIDAANASLLNNFEIAATSLIAVFLLGEKLSPRLCAAIVLVTAASIILGFDGSEQIHFNTGSLFVLGACLCWGLENNCTRKLSAKSSVQITMIKGCFSGLGSLILALLAGERFPDVGWIAAAAVLGFVSYGLSINFYIKAQRELGAAKTSVWYSIAPFIGVVYSILFGEKPGLPFYAGLIFMAAAAMHMAVDTGVPVLTKGEKVHR